MALALKGRPSLKVDPSKLIGTETPSKAESFSRYNKVTAFALYLGYTQDCSLAGKKLPLARG